MLVGLAQRLEALRVGFRVVLRQQRAVRAADDIGIVGRLDAQANPAAHDQPPCRVSGRSGRFSGSSQGMLAKKPRASWLRFIMMQRFQCSLPWRSRHCASSSSLALEQFHSALPNR
ncbi:hypothetical protein D3C79_940350 [compost metagenome]